MAIRHVIHLDGRNATLFGITGPAGEVRTGSDDPGPVIAALTAAGGPPVALLLDVLDEEHQRTKLPRVGRRDRPPLVARRLARAFPKTNLRTLQPGPPASSGDEPVVLSALTRPEPIHAWLAALAAARIPVAGVFSPALLTADLLRRLGVAAPAVLLVSRQSDGSLRHTLVRDGFFAGSRLLRGGVAAAPGDGARLVMQVEESMRYFDPAFASAGVALEVLALVDTGDRLPLPDALPEYLHVRLLTSTAVREKLRLPAPPRATGAEALFAGLLQQRGGVGDFAGPPEHRYYRLWRWREGGRAAALVLVAAGVAGTASNAVDTLQARTRLQALRPELAALDGAAPVAVATGSLDAGTLRQSVDTLELLAADGVDPAAVLGPVGVAAAGLPDIRIDAVEWRRTGTVLTAASDPAADAGTDPDADPAADAEAADDGGDSTDGSGDAADGGTAPGPRRVLLLVRGHVADFAGDYPAAFASLDGFVEALKRAPGVTGVRATATPIDVNPGATLSGEVSPGTPLPPARFVVQVLLSFDRA